MQNQQIYTSNQETMPLVSFIITYYNLPVQMLQECIESILQLSLRPFEREIIVIDDGTYECPINDLMKYEDDIIYVRQKNSGVSTARNKGLDMAKGKFIQLIDADDSLIQAPYEQCLDIIRYKEDVDMVMFDFTNNRQVDVMLETVRPVSGTTYMRNNEKMYATNYKAYFYRKHDSSVTSHTDNDSIQKRLDDSFSVIKHLNELSDKMPHTDKIAIQRRTAQLTMDYIYNTIMMTRQKKELERRIKELYANGLFPLPDGNYSTKYNWFRRLANYNMGRTVLFHTLPLMKKER